MKRLWTKEDDDLIRNNVKHNTVDEIAILLNRTGVATRVHMSKLGIKCQKRKRKYPINEHYFDNLNSNSAYIIGHAMADGCVRETNDGKFQLTYCISAKDVEILEFIRNEIGSTLPIGEYRINEAMLRMNSKIIFNSLSNYGIIPRKSGKESLKNISKEYFYDYLRGMSDGDGTVVFTKRKGGGYEYCWKIYCSNEKYLHELRDFEGSNIGYIRQMKTLNSFYCWDVKKIEDILYIKDKLYSKNNFCLQRKKDKFDMIENYYNIRTEIKQNNDIKYNGCKFGYWTVIKKDDKLYKNQNHKGYVCKCVCGSIKIIPASNLIYGKSKSCGCMKKVRC